MEWMKQKSTKFTQCFLYLRKLKELEADTQAIKGKDSNI